MVDVAASAGVTLLLVVTFGVALGVGSPRGPFVVVVVIVAEVVVERVFGVHDQTDGEPERPVVVTTSEDLADADVLLVLVEAVVVPEASLTGVEDCKAAIGDEFVRVCPVVMIATVAVGLVAFLMALIVVCVVVTDPVTFAVIDAFETICVVVSVLVVGLSCCVAFVVSILFVLAATDDIVDEIEDVVMEKFRVPFVCELLPDDKISVAKSPVVLIIFSVSSTTGVPVVVGVGVLDEFLVVLIPTGLSMLVNFEDVCAATVVLTLYLFIVVISSATNLVDMIGIAIVLVVLLVCDLLAASDEVLMAGGGALEPVVV